MPYPIYDRKAKSRRNWMNHEQKGVCAICGEKEQIINSRGVSRRLSIDHDHLTGRIRGLLCSNCNSGLGMFKDNQTILRMAIRYLGENDLANARHAKTLRDALAGDTSAACAFIKEQSWT